MPYIRQTKTKLPLKFKGLPETQFQDFKTTSFIIKKMAKPFVFKT